MASAEGEEAMNGLLFLLFNLGVVLVAHWCVQNDTTSLDGATKGLFAMAKPPQDVGPGPASPTRGKKLTPAGMRLPRLTRR
jgi:hypothetical protein